MQNDVRKYPVAPKKRVARIVAAGSKVALANQLVAAAFNQSNSGGPSNGGGTSSNSSSNSASVIGSSTRAMLKSEN